MKPRYKQKKKSSLLKSSPRLANRIVGFHVYRSLSENLPFIFWERVTEKPIREGNFTDRTASPGERYFYKMTQVDASGNESEPITPQSTYTDHAGNVFNQNPLVDLVGYNFYRSADQNVPLDQWERRNSEPLPSPEFKDEGVQSGEAYFYYIRAVDSLGNESAPGEVVRVIRK